MKNRKRILAALLAVVMTISMLPVSAFAAETAGDTAAENDAEPVIVSNEEYEAEPTVEDVSSQDAQEEAEVEAPSEETAENKAAEPEAQSETEPETQSESKPEAQPEVIPASEPEEEQPAQPETEPASAEESAEAKEEAAEAEPVTLTYEGRDYTVTAAFDPSAFPAGVQMKAREIRKSNSSYQDLYDQALETVQKETEEEVEITHARFFDITFYTEEEDNIEPDGTVNVNIKYTKPQLIEIETSGSRDDKVDEVSFDTEGFSVYAVIGTQIVNGNTAYNLLTVNFYGADHDTPITTMSVTENDKTNDTVPTIPETIVYDPQGDLTLGEYTFYGWAFEKEDYEMSDAKPIEDIRKSIAATDFSEVSTVSVYAVLFRFYTVEYFDKNATAVFDSEHIPYKEDGQEVDYTLDFDYPIDDPDFAGWEPSNVNEGHITYPENVGILQKDDIIKINGDVSFYAYIPQGYYLHFDKNGDKASYTAPQYVPFDKAPVRPPDPVRTGYKFICWLDEQGEEYEFTEDKRIEQETTLTASWEAKPRANYRVVIWKQKLLRNSAQPNEAELDAYTVDPSKPDGYEVADVLYYNNALVINEETGETNTINLLTNPRIVRFTGSAGDSRKNFFRIKGPDADHNPGADIDIKFTGFSCALVDSDVEIRPEGDAVLNVYFDRNRYRFNFDLDTHIVPATFNLEYIEAYYEQPIQAWLNNKTALFISFKSKTLFEPYFRQDEVVYYCPTMPPGDHDFYVNLDGGFRRLYYYKEDLENSPDAIEYNGKKYKLYRAFNTKQEYWYVETFNVPEGTTCAGAQAMEYKNTDWFQWNYVPTEIPHQGTGQAAYELGWYALLTGGSGLTHPPYINVFFDRVRYALTFMDGVYFDGDDNPHPTTCFEPVRKDENIAFEASLDLDDYKNYKLTQPPAEGMEEDVYIFSGWYLDRACREPVDFSNKTMPSNGLTLYAKWHSKQYRVFLHPKAGESEKTNGLRWKDSEEEGDYQEEPQMTFRLNPGIPISAPYGRRTGHVFDGWYLNYDEETDTYSDPLPSGYTLDDDKTKPYDQTEPTDDMDEYGNGATYNKDKRENRAWVQRKLDIYGKWIPDLVGADGIHIVYSLGTEGAEQTVEAPLLYKDKSTAIALSEQEAISLANNSAAAAAPDGKVFTGWTLQNFVTGQKNEQNGTYPNAAFTDGDTVLPGDTFDVRHQNAKITEGNEDGNVLSYYDAEVLADENPESKFYYVIRLKANYVDIKSAVTTYIPWYDNHDNLDAFHEDTVADGGKSTLAINTAVDVQPARERIGYKFIGWAKVFMGDNETAVTKWKEHPENFTQNLTAANLFLYYNKDDRSFYADSSFTQKVEKVAADVTNYEAMFAVWERSSFTVYHSSDGTSEKIDVPLNSKGDTLATFNMVKRVKSGMYGGYYDYDVTNNKRTFTDRGPGTAMYPQEDKTYYLKEVNVNYLKPQLYIVYSNATRVVSGLYGLVNVDSADDKDNNIIGDYKSCGLLIRKTNTQNGFEQINIRPVTDDINVTRKGQEGNVETLGRSNFGDFFSNENIPFFVGCTQIDQNYIGPGVELEIKGYYITKDGIHVTGSKSRMIKFESPAPVKFSGWGSDFTKTGIVNGTYLAVPTEQETSGEGNGDGAGTQNAVGAKGVRFVRNMKLVLPEEKITYSVKKFDGTEELDPQTVEPGARSGEINYPEKDGYLFTGWFQDESLSTPADFSDVQGDMTVYAGYIPKKDVTLSLARKSGKTGDVTFTATVSIKNTNKFTEVGVSCDHDGEKSEEALTKKTYVNVGSSKSPKYTYKFSGPVEVKSLEATDNFTASVYWVTKDGTRVMADAKTCTYKGGSVKVQN